MRGSVAEAAGAFDTVDHAVAVLANLASPYFQVLALIANAAVEEPEDLVAYTPPATPEARGEFIVQRHSQSRAPAARLRPVAAQDAMAILAALQSHPRAERLHRALAHYRMALNQLTPENRVLAAESLWMAVENLTHVVFDRLCGEHEIDPSSVDAKHRLTLALGFEPKRLDERSRAVQALIETGELDPKTMKRDNSHLDALDAHIRVDVLLRGDRQCYKQLKAMSDGFEHGYMTFGDVRKKSEVADAAFSHLRRTILGEIGIDDSSPLLDPRFDDPQAVWRPILQARGEIHRQRRPPRAPEPRDLQRPVAQPTGPLTDPDAGGGHRQRGRHSHAHARGQRHDDCDASVADRQRHRRGVDRAERRRRPDHRSANDRPAQRRSNPGRA